MARRSSQIARVIDDVRRRLATTLVCESGNASNDSATGFTTEPVVVPNERGRGRMNTPSGPSHRRAPRRRSPDGVSSRVVWQPANCSGTSTVSAGATTMSGVDAIERKYDLLPGSPPSRNTGSNTPRTHIHPCLTDAAHRSRRQRCDPRTTPQIAFGRLLASTKQCCAAGST